MERLAYGGGMLANVRSQRWLWLVLPFYLLGLLLAAMGQVLGGRIQVVHAHWIVPQGLVAVLLKKLLLWRKLSVVLTAHGSDLRADMGGLGRRVLQWTMRQADALAVVSEDMRQLAIALGVPEGRVMVASMGVDMKAFSPPLADSPRKDLLYVGRLVEEKGVIYLLEAFSRLAPLHPDLRLRIVGDGPLRPALEAMAQLLGIALRIEFLGARAPRDIPGFFRKAAVFVMPSIQEGLGLVAAEALACGCPVVAHDIAGVRDLVRAGETGIMVMPRDVSALAAAIDGLLRDPVRAAQLAEAGRQHIVSQYSWQAVAARYARLYAGD